MKKAILVLAMFLAACAGPSGDDGKNGTNGVDGAQGPAGQNGSNGVDGQNSIIAVIDPCGDGPGLDEVILRLNDGRLLTYYKTGTYEFLTVLGPGNYRTTDQQNCLFTVDAAGNVIY